MLPNFLVCGVQKAATTSLYAYLRQHPQIYLPDTKELNYFNLNWDKPLAWYEDLFTSWTGQAAVGEVSPLYMWEERVPERIAQTLDNPRLIFLLRNPIDRAYSNYWFNVERGAQNPAASFGEAIRSKEGEYRYLSKGLYEQQLNRYAAFFRRERLLVLYTEILRSNPRQTLRSVFEFLEIDREVEVSVSSKHNATRVPSNPMVSSIWARWLKQRDHIKRIVPQEVADWTRSARKGLHARQFKVFLPPPMDMADREYLREWYSVEVANLERLLGKGAPWGSDFGRPDAS